MPGKIMTVARSLVLGTAAALGWMGTAGAALPVAPGQPLVATSFAARVLAAHNRARHDVGLDPLAWDEALAVGAGQYAAYLARTGTFDHSPRSSRPGVGENLWMGTRGAYAPEQMIGGWLSEKAAFVPGIFPNVSRTGNWMHVSHYTAIIWPTTTRVGCGLAAGRSGDYLVCRYSPKGNQDGKPVGGGGR